MNETNRIVLTAEKWIQRPLTVRVSSDGENSIAHAMRNSAGGPSFFGDAQGLHEPNVEKITKAAHHGDL